MPPPARLETPSDRDRVARSMVMATHGLFLGSILVPVLPLLIGVVLAYATRAEAPPLWQTHFDDAIRTFWLCLLLALIGGPLVLVFGIGLIPIIAAIVLLVFRATRGLLRAMKWEAA